MEAAKRELQTKLTQLQMTRDKTETVLTSKNSNRIKRHVQSLQAFFDCDHWVSKLLYGGNFRQYGALTMKHGDPYEKKAFRDGQLIKLAN